jgi:N-acetylmuramoyl-L-alanine amidase
VIVRRALMFVAVLLAAGLVACSGVSARGTGASTVGTDPDVVSATLPSTTTTEPPTTDAPTTTAAASADSSNGSTLVPLAAGSLSGRVVVIDPGHNGQNWSHSADISQQVFIGNRMKECDTSGTATSGGYSETAHNWDVAVRTGQILRNAGATVVMTRADDNGWGPCITERAAIGNDAHGDVAVSIHADGGPDGGRGFHVLYPSPVAGYSDRIAGPSQRLAVLLRDAYGARTAMPTSNYVGSDGLMARDDLGGLNLSTIPKVFIETGNMRNVTDAALLTDAEFRQREAEGIAAGLASYLGSA